MNRLPVAGAVLAAVATLGAFLYVGYVGGASNQLTDVLLGPSEVFAWLFVHGDNAESLMQLYRTGFPFGVAVNVLAGSLVGWLLRRAYQLAKHRA